MILCIPVVDQHELTKVCLDSLGETMTGADFTVVIYDNNSEKPYNYKEFIDCSFPIEIIHSPTNDGYYIPLKKIYDKYPDELIGLIHNDMIMYERSWNERMAHSFANDPKLGLVGLCGSNEVDDRGGRGGGTVCYFRGGDVVVGERTITGQTQAAGRRTNDLVPSACLDSLFMMFRRGAVDKLEDDWDNLPMAHFYDRIWPLRLVRDGWHVATLGVECDHLGGMTSTGNVRFRNDCIKWLEDRNIPYDNPETSLYLEAERRYFREFKDTGFIPCRIDGSYNYAKY